MNKRHFPVLFLLIIFALNNTTLSAATGNNEIFNLVSTFYGDAKTTRAFAWSAASQYQSMAIRYAKADTDWDTNYLEVRAGLHGNNTTDSGTQISHFKVHLSGLEPGTTYVYRIGSTPEDYWSDPYAFTTEAENTESFSFIGVTDMQGTYSKDYAVFSNVLDAAMKDAPDAKFFVSLGDQVDDAEDLGQWKRYFDAFSKYAPSLPVMAVMGNHEAYGDTQTAGYHFMLHFNNPQNGGRKALGEYERIETVTYKTQEMLGLINNINGSFYSFDYGNVHFSVLNSGSSRYTDICAIPLLKAQKDWLEADLKASDAEWKIVMIHQGLYPAQDWRYFGIRDVLEDVIDKHGVDLVLQGHDHIVMRTYPMKNGKIVTEDTPEAVTKDEGAVYFIPGASGVKSYGYLFRKPFYAAVLTEAAEPTYSVFTVNGNRLTVITKNLAGHVVDTFTIAGPDNQASEDNPFTDVKENDWFYRAVLYAYHNKITSGVSDTEFAPNNKVTRGEFITMLCRAYGISEMTGDNFSDCGNTWYTGYLAAAKQLGISSGIGDNQFAPDLNITREEMVTLIYNYLKSAGETDGTAIVTETAFRDDAAISGWAKAGVAFAFENKYVGGKGNQQFAPKDNATRAELVQIFMNIFSAQ